MMHDKLKSLLHYDPETGLFTWLVKRGKHLAGRICSCKNAAGYIVIRIDGKLYSAHRLAYLYMNGCWPEKEIDHINLDKSDNRFKNLRQASRCENMQNTGKRSHNKTGIIGISICKQTGKYAAEIKFNKTRYFLGRFDCLELASLVVSEHRDALHFKFARAI